MTSESGRTATTTRPARPTSPSLSVSTDTSAFNFGPQGFGPPIIISKSNLRSSLGAFENVLKATAAFREAILQLSVASENLANALDECSKLKGARHGPFHNQQQQQQSNQRDSLVMAAEESLLSMAGTTTSQQQQQQQQQPQPQHSPSERLMASAGLHYLMSNHEQVLADIIQEEFEVPLRKEFQDYQDLVTQRQIAYDKELQERSKKIQQTETANLKSGWRKQRDLQSFRNALTSLQTQVDELDTVKANYYSSVLDTDQQIWETIASHLGIVVRSEIDLFKRISEKEKSDKHIETMVQANPDPYNVEGIVATDMDIERKGSILPASPIYNGGYHSHFRSNTTNTNTNLTNDKIPEEDECESSFTKISNNVNHTMTPDREREFTFASNQSSSTIDKHHQHYPHHQGSSFSEPRADDHSSEWTTIKSPT